jgi:hypothetical protein
MTDIDEIKNGTNRTIHTTGCMNSTEKPYVKASYASP